MLEVDDMIVDIRSAPYEIQVLAYENGLIPYIPDDKKNNTQPIESDWDNTKENTGQHSFTLDSDFNQKDAILRDQAQDIAYQAMEYHGYDNEQAEKLCREALAIYPNCVDALHILADLESRWERDFVLALKHTVEIGRRDLGEQYFLENKGDFWSLLETRPFMRAMGSLAQVLAANDYCNSQDQAIAIHEEMLELNPNDNQGIRYGLLGCYLTRQQYRKAQKLLDQYPADCRTFFLWGKVLLEFATKGETAALKALEIAREQNPYVASFFYPRKQVPKEHPGPCLPGGENEAISCTLLLHNAWKAHSPARKWLKQICAEE